MKGVAILSFSVIITALSYAYSQVNTPTTVECNTLTKDQVTNLFYLWNTALATLNSQTVANRYTSDAVLLATVSDQPRNTTASIKDYFDTFLLNKPQGVILYSDPDPGCNKATDMGVYEFTMGKDGSKVKARYSYAYRYLPDSKEWKISHHHSSMMPEQFLATDVSSRFLFSNLLILILCIFVIS